MGNHEWCSICHESDFHNAPEKCLTESLKKVHKRTQTAVTTTTLKLHAIRKFYDLIEKQLKADDRLDSVDHAIIEVIIRYERVLQESLDEHQVIHEELMKRKVDID